MLGHCGRRISSNVLWSGKVHDSTIVRKSCLFAGVSKGTFPPQNTVDIHGIKVPPFILGDATYFLLPWRMKPYTGTCTSGRRDLTLA